MIFPTGNELPCACGHDYGDHALRTKVKGNIVTLMAYGGGECRTKIERESHLPDMYVPWCPCKEYKECDGLQYVDYVQAQKANSR